VNASLTLDSGAAAIRASLVATERVNEIALASAFAAGLAHEHPFALVAETLAQVEPLAWQIPRS
jgi:hypothetical protein